MATKILFAPSQSREILDIAEAMTPPGFELAVVDPGTPEFYKAAADAEYFLGLARQMGGEFFRSAPKLRLVQLLSAGYDRVDVEAARKAKVPVANNGGANAIAVAEHTVMLMLAVAKRLVRFHIDVVAGSGGRADARVYELAGKTLGIVGLGNIGKKVARRAAAFDMDVRYYDIKRLTEDAEDAFGVRFLLLGELLRTADVVSLHVPLDDTTRRMIGAPELAMMKRTAILVNTCRGPGRSTRTPSTRRWWTARSPARGSTCSWTSRRRPGIRCSRSQRHAHAPLGGPHVGELGVAIQERVRQHPARCRRRSAAVGDSRAGLTLARRPGLRPLTLPSPRRGEGGSGRATPDYPRKLSPMARCAQCQRLDAAGCALLPVLRRAPSARRPRPHAAAGRQGGGAERRRERGRSRPPRSPRRAQAGHRPLRRRHGVDGRSHQP